MKRLLAVLAFAASSLGAQSLPLLPRATPTGAAGLRLADSSLIQCMDSANTLNRACTFRSVQQRLAFKAFDSLITPKLNLTGATITGSPTWSSTFTAASGQRVDSATGSARAQILTTARTIGGVSFNGSANIIPDTATGVVRAQTLTTSRTLWGVSFNGSANATTAPTFGAGATVSSGQTLTLTGATITGLTAASVGAGTFPAGTFNFTGSTISGSPGATFGAITVSSCSGCASSVVVQDTVRAVTFDSVKATRMWNVLGSATLPPYSFTQARGAGMFAVGNATSDTVRFATDSALSLSLSGGAAATLIGGAGNMIVQAGTGASRTLTFKPTNAGSVAFNSLILKADSVGIFKGRINTEQGGTATNPGIVFNGYSNLGIGAISGGTDTLFFGHSNGRFLSFPFDNAVPSVAIRGGAVSMTILAGTGNNRTLTFQSSNSTGTATTFASGSGDTLKITAHAIAAGLTAASGTPHAACFDATTHEMEDNAALTCTVSARRFKTNIAPLSLAESKRIVLGLQPSTFTYKNGGRKSIGLIAEEVDSVDTRLTFRDEKGTLNSVDYQALGPILARLVQDQQRRIDVQQQQIDSLKNSVSYLACVERLRQGGKPGICVPGKP